jgi:ERCC4-type nuclease
VTDDCKLSTILVEAHEDSKTNLVARLVALGHPARRVNGLPFDLSWSSDGKTFAFDNKTAEDLMASAEDGRLHEQVEAMKARATVWGFVLEGPLSEDGYVVGYGPHAWNVDRLDNLILSLQCEGAVIVHSTSQARTASRIGALYKWSAKRDHGSWHAPVRPQFTLQRDYGDKDYRRHVEAIMSLFERAGETIANELLDRYTFAEILGITPDGLQAAAERWVATPRVGKVLAKRWAEFLSQDYSLPVAQEATA